MSRPVKPAELNWITAFLVVRDVNEAVHFYTTVFNFSIHESATLPSGKMIFARIRYNETNIIIAPHGSSDAEHPGRPPIITHTISPVIIYVYCNDLEERYKKSCDYGLDILSPIKRRFWGDTMFSVVDPEGYVWDFATNITDPNPELFPKELL